MGHSQRHQMKCVHRRCDYVTTSTTEDRIHNVIHQLRSTDGHKECLLCPNASKLFHLNGSIMDPSVVINLKS